MSMWNGLQMAVIIITLTVMLLQTADVQSGAGPKTTNATLHWLEQSTSLNHTAISVSVMFVWLHLRIFSQLLTEDSSDKIANITYGDTMEVRRYGSADQSDLSDRTSASNTLGRIVVVNRFSRNKQSRINFTRFCSLAIFSC